MRKGETKSGFKFKIDEQNLNDMEFIENLAAAQSDALMFPKVIEQLLGKDQKEKLYAHLRDKNGHVPVEATVDAITEIMVLAGDDTKNS